MKNRFASAFFSVLIFFGAGFCAFPKSLSIQIIQNNPGQDKIWDTSYFLEQCITDYFFDNGQIVSSSPVWISSTDEKNSSALKAALAENLEGGMDYLVRIEIFYSAAGESPNPQALLLANVKKVEWKSYLVKTGIAVSSGSAVPESLSAENNNELGLSDFAGLVAYKINNGLKSLR